MTCQKLDNSRCQTGNFVEQQSCLTKLLDLLRVLLKVPYWGGVEIRRMKLSLATYHQ